MSVAERRPSRFSPSRRGTRDVEVSHNGSSTTLASTGDVEAKEKAGSINGITKLQRGFSVAKAFTRSRTSDDFERTLVENEQLKQAHSTDSEKIEQLETRASQDKVVITTLTNEKAALSEKLERSESEVQRAKTEFSELWAEHQALLIDSGITIASLGRSNQHLEQKLSSEAQINKTAQESLAELTIANEALSARVEDAEKRVERNDGQHEEDTKSLRNEIDALKAALEQHNKRREGDPQGCVIA